MLKTIVRLSNKPICALLLLVALIGCGPPPATAAPTDATTTQSEPDESAANEEVGANNNSVSDDKKASEEQKAEQNKPQPIFPALAPGEYCYTTKTAIDTIHARFTIDDSDRVIGNVQGVIHNEADGYYTSYIQAVDGTIDGSNLNLDVATWIEYDKQNNQETWKVSDSTLTVNKNTLNTESCNTVNKAFQNEDGLEAKDLTDGAVRVHTQQVFYDSGSSSTVVSNAVVRGDRDVYQLTAQGGQEMKLAISSTEDNAVFDIVSPSGMILGTELTQEDIPLPHTGDYKIIVGGTRGNATYELSIEIN